MKIKVKNILLALTTFFIVLTFSPFSASQNTGFTPFELQTKFSTTGAFSPSKDIRLEAVVIKGKIQNNFHLVKQVTILTNTNNLLAAVRGPQTPIDPLVEEGPSTESPTGEDLAASLGNLNLSSLVNLSEEEGTAVLEITFAQAVQTFCFWERGANSDFLVEALSEDGTSIRASYKVLRSAYQDAGYSLVSTGGNFTTPTPQAVGAIGLHLQGTTTRLRLTSQQPTDNGPDLKLVAL